MGYQETVQKIRDLPDAKRHFTAAAIGVGVSVVSLALSSTFASIAFGCAAGLFLLSMSKRDETGQVPFSELGKNLGSYLVGNLAAVVLAIGLSGAASAAEAPAEPVTPPAPVLAQTL